MKTCCTPTANAVKEQVQPILPLSEQIKPSVTLEVQGKK